MTFLERLVKKSSKRKKEDKEKKTDTKKQDPEYAIPSPS